MHDTWLIVTMCYLGLVKTGKNGKKWQQNLKKYILAREQKEFKEEMKREVSASLPLKLSKEKQDLKCV